MKAIYTGWYGFLNSGDDAFCEVASWGASKYWGATRHLFFSQALPQLKLRSRNYSPVAGRINRLRAAIDIRLADIFVSAGGSTFDTEITPQDVRAIAASRSRLEKSRAVGAIGVSIGPFRSSSDEKSVVNHLKKLDFLALRDKQSYVIAQGYNLSYEPVLAADLAALLPSIHGLSPNRKPETRSKKIIGLAIGKHRMSDSEKEVVKEERRVNHIVTALAKFIDGNAPPIHLRIFIFNGHHLYGDELIAKSMAEKIAAKCNCTVEIVNYNPSVGDVFRQINECDLLISSRLHASIFACYGRTPFLLLEYHRKCSDFLDDVGQHERFRIGDGDIDVFGMRELIEELLGTGYFPPKNLQNTESRALLNFTATLSGPS
jgi:polysaccharide pyruvyl transferase WcaK-like protein